MNKNTIKNYAVWARTELMRQVAQKAFEYNVTESSLPDYNTDTVNGRLLSSDEKKQLNELITQVNKHGYMHVIEETAYTWFNRFIALRYMEVNNYLPQKIRVFTNDTNEFKPDLLTDAIHVELKGLDKQKVFDYIEENKQEKLYKYLLLTLCNDMNQYLPDMFTSIKDYKTLLFPDNLLKDDSVLAKLITDIDDDSWMDQVQIIGWLYQYYIQMPKDELIHAKKQYKNDDVPFVTQLFTPDWIVRYLVENTLGNYYVRKNPDTDLINDWKYFIKNNSTENNLTKIEDIKFIDPCIGSGHILVYAFDLLMSFYQENGYTSKDATELILENNLYGFDVDERAYQLAYFSLMMKARQYNRRILSSKIKPNVYCINNIKIESALYNYLISRNSKIKTTLINFKSIFDNANTYGSLLNVTTLNNEEMEDLESEFNDIISSSNVKLEEMLFQLDIKNNLLPALKIAKLLKSKYDFVVTNPPYLGSSLMPNELKKFVQLNYKEAKSDLFAAFIKKCIHLSNANGYIGMLTPYVWMFISSYESLRHYVLLKTNISGLIQLEYNAFEAACVPVATFILHNSNERYKGNYIRLSNFKGAENQAPKTIEAIQNQNCGYYFETSTENFSKIPGSPIAYWANANTIDLFNSNKVDSYMNCKSGIMTGSDDFIKLWFEPSIKNIKFDCNNQEDMKGYKWFPLNSGGGYRKWYGNNIKIVNLYNDGEDIRKSVKNYRLRDSKYYFQAGITWGRITSNDIAFRDVVKGSLFDDAGPIGFITENRWYILSLLNSCVVRYLLNILNPTLNFQVHDITTLPVFIKHKGKVEQLCNSNIKLSQSDWDSFENSWDFKVHPLVRYSNSLCDATDVGTSMVHSYGEHIPSSCPLETCFLLWQGECNERFDALKANEEELNRIFIDIYGLQDELTPEVEEKDVTVRKANLTRDIKSLISYAVGCMFGRYSLDVEGLAYAGGEWDSSKYSTFIPDSDDIIPICDEDYFEDDILTRFIEFLRVVYGPDTLEENLQFITDALGGKGTPREVLRNYFLNDFFKDHCNTYQVTGSGKRPIYWLFDSGKKNGFKALVYIHRYTPDLIARMRTGYIHPQQARYRTQIEMLQGQIHDASNSNEKVKLSKQLKKINEQLLELNKYEEVIHHWADKMEPMDLDDGVKVNYAKFQELLAKIK